MDHKLEKSKPFQEKNVFLENPEKLLESEKAELVLDNVRKAVFNEFDRALLEGTATKEQVELQKRHTQTVEALVQYFCQVLREEGIEITTLEENTARLMAILHDAMKIVPERTRIDFGISRARERIRLLRQSQEISQRLKEIGEAIKKRDWQRLKEIFSFFTYSLKEIKRERDRLKKIKEGGSLEDLEEYEKKSLKESGIEDDYTRLLRHGEDAAEWAEQLLRDLGFGSKFIDRIKSGLITHMGMPYVEKRLVDAWEHLRNTVVLISEFRSQLKRAIESGNQEEIEELRKKIEKKEQEFSQWLRTYPRLIIGRPVLKREVVERQPAFPSPANLESALLFAADLLSPGIMAGRDLENDSHTGCFDRYLLFNLNVFCNYLSGEGFKEAFEEAEQSVVNNIERLKAAFRIRKRPERVKEIEALLGEKIGAMVLAKLKDFRDFLERKEEEKPLIVNGKEARSLDDLTVRKMITVNKEGKAKQIAIVDPLKTMNNYYEAVRLFRQHKGIDPGQALLLEL